MNYNTGIDIHGIEINCGVILTQIWCMIKNTKEAMNDFGTGEVDNGTKGDSDGCNA